MGFDFHVCDSGPQLIEINTNAGGAMLNRALAHAQQPCCAEIVPHLQPTTELDALDRRWLESFLSEWALQGRSGQPRRIAIVDEAPEQQYLHPEFLLFEHLFRSAGIDAVTCDPGELAFGEGVLTHMGRPVDLVSQPPHRLLSAIPGRRGLAQCLRSGAIVLTPHPRAHALYADKRNLSLLSDPARLAALGVPQSVIDCLVPGIPRTVEVTPERAETLWAARRDLFFKPASGFGSRAAYRGDKLTRRVWQGILGGGYVAQRFAIPPSAGSASTAPATTSSSTFEPMSTRAKSSSSPHVSTWVRPPTSAPRAAASHRSFLPARWVSRQRSPRRRSGAMQRPGNLPTSSRLAPTPSPRR